jgi:hypothetical protein
MGMRKGFLLFALVVVLVWAGTVGALGQEANIDAVLTRGEFATMLVESGGLEGELPPADLLVEKGIMQGYPDGESYLDKGITRVEAVVLAAKALGLEGSIVPPVEVEVPLPADHWGYNLYGWFVRQGLVEGRPGEVLSREQGAAFLDKVFGIDPAAIELLEQGQAKVEDMEGTAVRSVMSGIMSMIPRKGLDVTEEIPEFGMEVQITQEMIMPATLHQVVTMGIEMPGEEMSDLTSEVYLVDGKMYQKMPNPETGVMEWFQYPEDLLPNMDELLDQTQQPEVIPAGLEEYLHYHLLGTTEVKGEEVYVISFYGRVDDFNQFLAAALGQMGGAQEIQQAMAPMLDMIKSMSYWGIQYVGVDDLMVHSGDFTAIVTYADEIMGEAMPIEAMVMSMELEEYSYDEDITIEVPEEVLAAPVLDLSLPVGEPLPEELS